MAVSAAFLAYAAKSLSGRVLSLGAPWCDLAAARRIQLAHSESARKNGGGGLR